MGQYQSYEDQELVQFMQNGDERVLTEIYNRYWDKMLAVAYNRLGNQEEAEECVQDVLYKFWKLRADFSLAKVDLSNYLARAIRNQSFNILDRRYRERVKSENYTPAKDINLLSPERQLMIRELQEQINSSINSLPPQCQIVFKLSRQDGLSNKEIAEKLNLSENTVKSHIKKANRDIQGDIELLTTLISFYIFFKN
ncbi:RNA polymerase sigma-70 factor (family 1) [Pedobacter africanus]|uniref:RNA polymerase sigma-70 factor (ECF subfamily) n=1 Tax=Pedobacter africanus TaxID=151894 RepID=A0ACC6KZY4_9SPHI|nr:RNA polymerase sigma-70 factor [Pedobacter africanus]MDR6784636.1 RNA polymerase sigma-70 factor (ECF subfamily) [Pedobacter africanus]